MARAITSIPDEWIPLMERRAVSLRRPSESNYLACLIEDDLRSAGLLAPASDTEQAELIALAAELGLPAALETLRRKLRTTKQPAA